MQTYRFEREFDFGFSRFGMMFFANPVAAMRNVRTALKPGAEPLTTAELIKFSRERVGCKAPEEIIVLDEMPLNATGKVDRAALKQLAEDLHGEATIQAPAR